MKSSHLNKLGLDGMNGIALDDLDDTDNVDHVAQYFVCDHQKKLLK